MNRWYEYGYEGFPSGERRRRFFRQRDDPCDSQEDLSGDEEEDQMTSGGSLRERCRYLPERLPVEDEDPFDEVGRWCTSSSRRCQERRKRSRRPEKRRSWRDQTNVGRVDCHGNSSDERFSERSQLFSSGRTDDSANTQKTRENFFSFRSCSRPLHFESLIRADHPLGNGSSERSAGMTEVPSRGAVNFQKGDNREELEEEELVSPVSSTDSWVEADLGVLSEEEEAKNDMHSMRMWRPPSTVKKKKEESFLSCALHGDPRLKSCFGGTCLSFVLQREMVSYPRDRRFTEMPVTHGSRSPLPTRCPLSSAGLTDDSYTIEHDEPVSTVKNEWISVSYGGAPPYSSSSLSSMSFAGTSGTLRGANEKSCPAAPSLPVVRSDFTIMRVTVCRNPVMLTSSSEEMKRRNEMKMEGAMHRTPPTLPIRPTVLHDSRDPEAISLQGELTVQCHPLDSCSPSVLVRVTDWSALHPALREANHKLSAHMVAPSRVGHCAVPLPMSSVSATKLLFPSFPFQKNALSSSASPPSHWWLLSLVCGGTSCLMNERHHRVGAPTLRQCRLDGKVLFMPALCATLIVEEDTPETADRQHTTRACGTFSRESLPPPKNAGRLPTSSVSHIFPPPRCTAVSGVPTDAATSSSSSSSSSSHSASPFPFLHRRLTQHQLYFPLRHRQDGVCCILESLAFATLTAWPIFIPSPSPIFSFVVLGGTKNGWCPASLEYLSLLHIATASWTWTTSEVQTTGSIPPARYGHSATLLPSHDVPLERWCTVRGEESGTQHPHSGHTTASVVDPWFTGGTAKGNRVCTTTTTTTTTVPYSIVVVGGVGKQRQYLSDVHMLQISTGVWRTWTCAVHPLTDHHVLSPQHQDAFLFSDVRPQEGGNANNNNTMEARHWGRPEDGSPSGVGVYGSVTTTRGAKADRLPRRSHTASSSLFSPLEPSSTFPCGGPRGRAFHTALLLCASTFCHVGRGVRGVTSARESLGTQEGQRGDCDSLRIPIREEATGVEKDKEQKESGSLHSWCSSTLHSPSDEGRSVDITHRHGVSTGRMPRDRHGSPGFSAYVDHLLTSAWGDSSTNEPRGTGFPPSRTRTCFPFLLEPSRMPFLSSSFSFLPSSCLASTAFSSTFASSPKAVAQRCVSFPLVDRPLPSPFLRPTWSSAAVETTPHSRDATSFPSSEGQVPRRTEEVTGGEAEGKEVVLLLIGGEGEDGLASSVWSLHLPRGEWQEWVYPCVCLDGGGGGGRTREETVGARVTEEEEACNRERGADHREETIAASEHDAKVKRERKEETDGNVDASRFSKATTVASFRCAATSLVVGSTEQGKTPYPGVPSFSLPSSSCALSSMYSSYPREVGVILPASSGTPDRRSGYGMQESSRLLPFLLPRVVSAVESQKLAFALRQEVERTRERMAYQRSACFSRDTSLRTNTHGPHHCTLVAPEWSFDSVSNSMFSLTVGSLPQAAVLPSFLWRSIGDVVAEEEEDVSTSSSPKAIARVRSSMSYHCPTSESWRSCGVLIWGGSSSFESSFLTTCILPMTDSLQGMAEMKLLSAIREGKLRVL